MGDLVLGPFSVGIDHVTSDTKLAPGAVHDAVNGDFNRSGEFTRRNGFAPLLSASGLHSLWTSPATQWTFCGQGASLCQVRQTGSGSLDVAPLVETGSMAPISFDDLNDGVLYANAAGAGFIRNGIALPLALPTPGAPAAVATSNGGLSAGRYGVGVSLMGESESALSGLTFIDVPEGGGIRLTLQTDTFDRLLYRTAPNGDALYLCASAPGALTSYLIGNGALGRLSETRHLAPLPGGQIIRQWRGRTFVARGDTVYFSEPMRYGLYSPREGFMQFASRVTLMEAVENGIFIGGTGGVIFLQGTKPSDFELKATSALAPYEGSGTVVPASLFGGDIGKSGDHVATWLAPNGFVIGTSTGQLIETQSDRIAIADSGATQARTFVHDRRLTSIIQ